ncbi:MAG: hypothetical protein HYS24_06420 [Ignavibacteriales bacterium]|nr:hypothetical protein [Ignavibacteriales bacterium]
MTINAQNEKIRSFPVISKLEVDLAVTAKTLNIEQSTRTTLKANIPLLNELIIFLSVVIEEIF